MSRAHLVHSVFLWNADFGHVASTHGRYMIRGVSAVVKGGFSSRIPYTRNERKRTGGLSIGSAYDTLRRIRGSLGLGDSATFEKGGHTK